MTTSLTCVPYKVNQTGTQRAAHYIRKGKQMKLRNSISDEGMKRVAQQGPLFGEEHLNEDMDETYDTVSAAMEGLRGVSGYTLSDQGSQLLNRAYAALVEFLDNYEEMVR